MYMHVHVVTCDNSVCDVETLHGCESGVFRLRGHIFLNIDIFIYMYIYKYLSIY